MARVRRIRRGADWWEQVVREQERSGEAIARLCKRYGVGVNSFYLWRKNLKAKQSPQFARFEIGLVNECEIRCRSGRGVIVRGAVSLEVLSRALEAAEVTR